MKVRKTFVPALLAALVALPTLAATSALAGSPNGITICHRTHSTTNPYRRITVGISAVNGSSTSDHTHHSGARYDPTYSYPANAKIWGDIIPPVGNRPAMNMTGSVLPSPCSGSASDVMTAQQFFNLEVEAGQSPADVRADLAEQGAAGDPSTFTTMSYTGSDPSLLPGPSTSPTPTPTPSASASASGSPSPAPAASVSPDPSALASAPAVNPSESASAPAPDPSVSASAPAVNPSQSPAGPPVAPPASGPVTASQPCSRAGCAVTGT